MSAPEVHEFVERRLRACKTEVDEEVHSIRDELQQLRRQVAQQGEDIHRITIAVCDMSGSLRGIAASVTRLSDLPETWANVKGFWSVMLWLRQNLLVLLLVLVFVYYVISASGAKLIDHVFR